MAAIKNNKNDLSFKSTKASAPKMAPNDVLLAVDFGGVLGRIKLNIPNSAEAPAAIIKVLSPSPMASLEMTRPATIQPSVPKTRIHGNCLPGSLICANATLLLNAMVGMYSKE